VFIPVLEVFDLAGAIGSIEISDAYCGENGADDEAGAADRHLRDPGGAALAGILGEPGQPSGQEANAAAEGHRANIPHTNSVTEVLDAVLQGRGARRGLSDLDRADSQHRDPRDRRQTARDPEAQLEPSDELRRHLTRRRHERSGRGLDRGDLKSQGDCAFHALAYLDALLGSDVTGALHANGPYPRVELQFHHPARLRGEQQLRA
jgi:hypothetical protein